MSRLLLPVLVVILIISLLLSHVAAWNISPRHRRSSSTARRSERKAELSPAASASALEELRREKIFFVGLMGSGKSTVSKALSKRLSMPCVDTDALVEQETQQRIADFFAAHGESAFRAREHSVLKEVSARSGGAVVATGGGIVTNPLNLPLLRTGIVVYLDEDPRRIFKTLAESNELVKRPLLREDPLNRLMQLKQERHPLYLSVADLVVANSSFSTRREVIQTKLIQLMTSRLIC